MNNINYNSEMIQKFKENGYLVYNEIFDSDELKEIKDQLDMLYHDLKSGNLNNGTWITAIDAVKERNPKPDAPEPIL